MENFKKLKGITFKENSSIFVIDYLINTEKEILIRKSKSLWLKNIITEEEILIFRSGDTIDTLYYEQI